MVVGTRVEVVELMLVVFDFLLLLLRHETVNHVLLLKVEVLEVNLPLLNVWFERRLDLLSFKSFDVQIFEPWVRQHFMHVILGSQTLLLVFIQKLLYNID